VVVATHNRLDTLTRTLKRLTDLPERPGIVVIDNGSSDGTADAIRVRYPDVRIIALDRNLGAAGRNLGVRAARAPYVAFSDDDSWWAPGALSRASTYFASHPRLGGISARILVGPDERLDPTSALMARSPLDADGLPGPGVLGFVACGAVVRREAFLETSGFHPRYGLGGEEDLLAIDLTAAGWHLVYLEDVVAHHHPASGPRPGKRRRTVRNALWTAWLRRPFRSALGRSVVLSREAVRDAAGRRGLAQAMAGLPWILLERRLVPDEVEQALRAVQAAEVHGTLQSPARRPRLTT
jgi:GT2 family glycosyltransferase